MKKISIVDQIEVTRDGHVQVRMLKQIVDNDGTILSSGNHRCLIEVGSDTEQMLAAVNSNLVALNCAPITSEEWDRVRLHCSAAWTPQVVAAWRVKQAE